MSGMGASTTTDFHTFRKAQGPLVDVRSPGEFRQAHWPGAINVPLFSDEQRAEVGTTYKQKGRNQAVELGLELVGPALASLARSLKEAAQDSAALRIYCWRGGMRSNSMAWLAAQMDLQTLVLEGGYKTYRHWVLDQFGSPWPVKLLGGRTGSGKTDLLLALAQRRVAVIDLEGLAHHRGSSFGGLGLPEQPSTEHYENRLAEALTAHQQSGATEIWLEAESAQVGRCRIPRELFLQMQAADVLEVRRTADERVKHLVTVYGHQGGDALAAATERISRRLGPQRTQQALDAIATEDWATACKAMLDYYDRCYDHELAQSETRHSVDISGLGPDQAAERLIDEGLVQPLAKDGN
ncbi:MAG: tRNA 2-selenouridine(34) synthase MnmH [Synechococcus sp.]|nr:tRNA 2-selenouridine(34) synthase MnmH [Synechococcus sp.]